MRSEYLFRQEFQHLLAALMPENRLAMEVCLCTGLRISDVLNLRSERLSERMTVRELKTGKNRTVSIPAELCDRLRSISGKIYVFEGRCDHRKHRTRQAVFKDLQRCAALFRLDGRRLGSHVSPHSARKIFAVTEYQKSGSLLRVQKLLNHSDEAVTMLYALADKMYTKRVI